MLCIVLEIARYVIYREWTLGHTISNLKLQKVLYFIQAEFLVSEGRACFKEDIIAWDFGPVILEVYNQYKIYGSAYIPVIKKNQLFLISSNDMEIIDNMLDELRDYSASYLTSLTHKQLPWIESYVPHQGKVISHKLIKNYFMEK